MKIELSKADVLLIQHALHSYSFEVSEFSEYMAEDDDLHMPVNAYIASVDRLHDKMSELLSNHAFDENSCKTEQNLV